MCGAGCEATCGCAMCGVSTHAGLGCGAYVDAGVDAGAAGNDRHKLDCIRALEVPDFLQTPSGAGGAGEGHLKYGRGRERWMKLAGLAERVKKGALSKTEGAGEACAFDGQVLKGSARRAWRRRRQGAAAAVLASGAVAPCTPHQALPFLSHPEMGRRGARSPGPEAGGATPAACCKCSAASWRQTPASQRCREVCRCLAASYFTHRGEPAGEVEAHGRHGC